MICVCLCSVIKPAKSNTLFNVNQCRSFVNRTIGVCLSSITEIFDWVRQDQIDYQDGIDHRVSWRLGSLST